MENGSKNHLFADSASTLSCTRHIDAVFEDTLHGNDNKTQWWKGGRRLAERGY